jgi:hypothetical protein
MEQDPEKLVADEVYVRETITDRGDAKARIIVDTNAKCG